MAQKKTTPTKDKSLSPTRVRKNIQAEIEMLDDINEFRKSTYSNLNFKINAKFKNKKQRELYDTILNNRITLVRGSAGTGKTLISLMAGLECVKNPDINIDQIMLTKPIIEVAKSLGALPGDVNEKTAGYFTHFYDNLIKIIGNEATKFLKQNDTIKETVLNFVRGSTFGKYDSKGNPIGSFCIVDESQNTTITEMKTFISRMGENTKIVIIGDLDQIDLKLAPNEISGFQHAWDILQDIPNIAYFEFTEDDIVREPMLIEIMKRYKLYPAKTEKRIKPSMEELISDAVEKMFSKLIDKLPKFTEKKKGWF